ncbi:MAG: nucleoside kinase [Oscillospiraceae bacterium]|nr:nucleoside kinase [Oscillospiraceae bacterium]
MNTIDIKKINEIALNGGSEFVRRTNEAYYCRLLEIADDIAANRHKRPIILLSGPSGSGKTTSALMIEKILDERGIETHTLSMDNYFKPFTDEERRLFAEGKIDLETPARMDSELLEAQLTAIEQCEPVHLPIYDFKESSRSFRPEEFLRRPGELVILEGIHSLNPSVVTIPEEKTAGIYVSVRTRVTMDGKTLHPSKIRLMRRLMRDSIFRKRSFAETIKMFRSVEEGENKYIMPYKHRSVYDVDTFMAYELCAYKPVLMSGLLPIRDNGLISDAVEFLEAVSGIDAADVTPDSLICEFIGNGQFNK